MNKALLGYMSAMAIALIATAIVMHTPSASAGGEAKASIQHALEKRKQVLDEI